MKIIIFAILIAISINCFSQEDGIKFIPINHASFIIQKDDVTIYADPVGDPLNYKDYPNPQLILVTHTHGDHFSSELLKSYKETGTVIIGSKSVIDKLGFGVIMNNGDLKSLSPQIEIEAIPMYNTTEKRAFYHPKGVGNGYLITFSGKRIYISGDTEDIPEMLSLKDIDHAFICMNLPYTMNNEQAASAVLKFKPKNVYPYHYSGDCGAGGIERFKEIVSVNKEIKVWFLKWY